jgi:hypothetical protein
MSMGSATIENRFGGGVGRAGTAPVFEQTKVRAAYAAKPATLSAECVGPDGRLSLELERWLSPLIQALFEANPPEAETTPLSMVHMHLPVGKAPPSQWSIQSLHLAQDHDRYPYLMARVLNGDQLTEMYVRTNGQAAFIDRSYHALQGEGLRSFRFAYLGDGYIGTDDQARFLLRQLPPTTALSRVMSEAEAEIWKHGDPTQLDSSFVSKGTHLGLANYRYRHEDPYQFDVPREVLERIHAKGQLVANTYEDERFGPRGMSVQARSPFGLEFELVVLGDGRRRLQPFLAAASR